MRIWQVVLVVAPLAACAPQVPDSAAGVGFGDYDAYTAQREAELNGRGAAPTTLAPTDPFATASVPAAQTTSTAAPATTTLATNNAGISDEQDFEAVSSRESIQSDAERIQAQRQQYTVVEPTALPERPSNSGANVVSFALSTTNAVGQSLYRRSSLFADSRLAANCAKYTSSDLAQQAFLDAGGPERDRLNLDPDGDGFACYWDPAPFRAARLN